MILFSESRMISIISVIFLLYYYYSGMSDSNLEQQRQLELQERTRLKNSNISKLLVYIDQIWIYLIEYLDFS